MVYRPRRLDGFGEIFASFYPVFARLWYGYLREVQGGICDAQRTEPLTAGENYCMWFIGFDN